MRYIKTYDNFTPIKINNAKPFKVKANLAKSIQVLQKSIQSLRRRLQTEESMKRRSEMNRDINTKVQKLKELTFYQLKQAEHFKNNPIVESSDNDEDKITLLQILESKDFKPEDIINYIGLGDKEYRIPTKYSYSDDGPMYIPDFDDKGVTIYTNSSILEKLMDIEGGIIYYLLQFSASYNNYEYDVEDDELNYINNYLSDDIINKIKKLSDIFSYKLDLEEGEEIRKFFEYLGLNDELENFKTEISYENERGVSKAANALLESLPFNVNTEYKDDFNLELYFEYDTIIEYMKKHNMKVENIKDFLENIYEASDFSYDFEYEMKQEYMGDFEDLKKEIDKVVQKYIDSPDDIFPKLIECDNLELFRNKFELSIFDYSYSYWNNGKRKQGDLFDMARDYNGKILQWYSTAEFKEKVKEKVDSVYYDELIKKIEDYEALEMSKKYNL